MGKKGVLKFHGHIDEEEETYEAFYQIGDRAPRPLPISRWSEYAEYFRWGIQGEQGCLQLAWTIIFAYLIKHRGMSDSKGTAELISKDMVEVLSERYIERLPDTWAIEVSLLDYFLIPCFPLQQFPVQKSEGSSSYF